MTFDTFGNLLSGLLGSLIGGGLAWWGSITSTNKQLSARRDELMAERVAERDEQRSLEEARRVVLMRAIRAEVQQNLDLKPWAWLEGFSPHSVYVLDMWNSARGDVGDLPDEALEAVRLAYALAARYNDLIAWERSIVRDRSRADLMKIIEDAGEEAHEAFSQAASVLEHWIRLKDEQNSTVAREGPAM